MFRSIQLCGILICLGTLIACQPKANTDYTAYGFEPIHQSEEFTISQKGEEYVLTVLHPFPGAAESESYHLIPFSKEPYDLEGITHMIQYPLSRISISSTTHLGYLEALGMQAIIVGASNPKLFYSEAFNSRVKAGQVSDIGGAKFNKEILIKLASDAVFAFAIGPEDLNTINDLRKSGIKVVLVSEFQESDPIEKAEWLKFFAVFFGEDKLRKSESLLLSIQKQYEEIKNAVSTANKKPSVMMGYPWKGSWYVSGGNSFQAKFFEDAGAAYVWSEFKQSGSMPLDVEVVLKKGSDTDFWLNPGNKLSIDEILQEHPSFIAFKAVKEQKVYSNYGRSNQSGANDSWESGVVRPDLILKDLATIFHPEIMGESDLYFYKPLEQ